MEVSQANRPKNPNLQIEVNANRYLHDGLRSSDVTQEEAKAEVSHILDDVEEKIIGAPDCTHNAHIFF